MGIAHFAAMLGIYTLTIWEIKHPYTKFAPSNQSFKNAIFPNL
ncbi:MAG: hypothetical protein QM495_01975 [Lutibacter sp.]